MQLPPIVSPQDSPEGSPQTPPYEWWKLHDEYRDAPPGAP